MRVAAEHLQLLGVLREVGEEALGVGRVEHLLDGVQRLHHHLPVLVAQLPQQDRTHHARVQRLTRCRETRQLVLGGLGTHALRRAQLLHQLPLIAAVRHRRTRLHHRRRVHGCGGSRRRCGSRLAAEQTARGLRGRSRRSGSRRSSGSRSAVATGRLGLRGSGGLEGSSGLSGRLERTRGLSRLRLGSTTEGAASTVQPVVLGSGRSARAATHALHGGGSGAAHRSTGERVHRAHRVVAVAQRLVEQVVHRLASRRLDGDVHRVSLQRIQRTREIEAVADHLVVRTHLALEVHATIHNQILRFLPFSTPTLIIFRAFSFTFGSDFFTRGTNRPTRSLHLAGPPQVESTRHSPHTLLLTNSFNTKPGVGVSSEDVPFDTRFRSLIVFFVAILFRVLL